MRAVLDVEAGRDASATVLTRMRLSKTSVSARTAKRATPTRLPSASSLNLRLAGSGSDRQRRVEQMLVVPLARQEHHPVLAEGDRLPVAVGGDVMDAVDRHCFRVLSGARCDVSGAKSAPEAGVAPPMEGERRRSPPKSRRNLLTRRSSACCRFDSLLCFHHRVGRFRGQEAEDVERLALPVDCGRLCPARRRRRATRRHSVPSAGSRSSGARWLRSPRTSTAGATRAPRSGSTR